MKHKKQIYWISLALAFSLIAGLAFPASNVNAAKKTKEKNDQKVLVVYFSATGTTKGAAKKIKKATNGKLYQIKAADPYTDEDLSYDNDDCRANTEQKDGSIRPKMKGSVKNIQDYDVIFLGYPIWWGKEPMIIRTFLESHHVKGKKIVPFCTSGSSGISDSRKGIRAAAKGAKVVKGKDLTDASRKSVKSWALGKVK